MATEILKLADGAITNITDDSWKSDGCPTCDYGAEYITELYLTTTFLLPPFKYLLLSAYIIYRFILRIYDFSFSSFSFL